MSNTDPVKTYLCAIFPDKQQEALFLLDHMDHVQEEDDLPLYTAARLIKRYLEYLTTNYTVQQLLEMYVIAVSLEHL